ncbi:MAG: hypothetical protein E7620_07605 [Ruminococcaceae bacterium]|nr:hypothetical protein [Oscillospiraceae bacterium]
MKRTLLILLSLLFVLSAFTGCGDDKGNTPTTNEATSEKEKEISDILGFGPQDYDADFNVLLNNSEGAFNMATDFYAEESSSDIVSQQILARNHACEEYLNITINYNREPGNWNSGMPAKIYNLVSGGSSEYDMVVMGLNTGIMGGYVDIYQNVLDMESVNPSHSWWVQEMGEMVSINDRLIFLTGDACLSTYAYLGCVFANLTVANRYNILPEGSDLFQLVKDGDWTMETFYTLLNKVRAVSSDDGITINPSVDTFGWANVQTSVRVMWSSCELNLVERQEDGTFALRESLDDRILNFIEDVRTVYHEGSTFHFTAAQTQTAIDAFVNDRCLFTSFFVYMAQDFTANNITSYFAILPLPKYDSNQTDYISTNISAYNALFFPRTIKDPVLSAQVAEFMGYYGQTRVVPAYYDESLKLRNNDLGEANVEMLDMIREKLRVNPNEVYGTIGDMIGITPTTIKNMGETGFYTIPTSTWETDRTTFNDGIVDYIFQYFR